MEEKKRTGLYLRLSREDDGDREESNSIASQRLMTMDYARLHELTVIDEYVDDGYTGTNFDRPDWNRLIADIRSGRINCVLVKDLSRLGRNNIECGRYLEELFPAWGVRFISISDFYDSEKNDDPGASLTLSFRNLLNDFYCRDISMKTKAAFMAKMKRGDFLGNFAPYGYKRDEENKNHLLVDEEEAEVVTEIFKLRISGMNNRSIADLLESRGIPSPAKRRGLSDTNPWNETAIRGILSNEVYLGNMVQGKTKKISYKSKKTVQVEPEKWIRVEDTHESIIGQNTFDYVHELMGMDATSAVGATHLNLLSGFLRCGYCGQNLIRFKSYEIPYYHCSDNARDKNKCVPNVCSEKKMTRLVTIALQRQAEKLRRILPLVESGDVIPKRKKQLAEVDEGIQKCIDKIAERRKVQADGYKAMMQDLISNTDYAEMERKCRYDIQDAENEIGRLRERRQKLIDGIAYLLPWLKTVNEFGNFKRINRTILLTLAHYVDVVDSYSIKVRFRFEDDVEEILEQAGYEEKPVARTILMSTPAALPAKDVRAGVPVDVTNEVPVDVANEVPVNVTTMKPATMKSVTAVYTTAKPMNNKLMKTESTILTMPTTPMAVGEVMA